MAMVTAKVMARGVQIARVMMTAIATLTGMAVAMMATAIVMGLWKWVDADSDSKGDGNGGGNSNWDGDGNGHGNSDCNGDCDSNGVSDGNTNGMTEMKVVLVTATITVWRTAMVMDTTRATTKVGFGSKF